MQPLAAMAFDSLSRENEIFVEHEALLAANATESATEIVQHRQRRSLWRTLSLALVVAIGATVAFVPAEVNDGLSTGRSVAHATR